ncbi:heme exporter protein A [Ketogulonicigenium robustum]|uniref:Heme exporter protein A n=1 Tax=Ketogulonicigenium robustum TaxID=92947 RepID=A0A1W6NZF1_9RHOB|nr:heme exporter protein A [Ketogulonicigenium robustum]
MLSGVNFTLAAGEALVLRGPNGAGKTTLLRVLAGLQPADAGDIEMPQGDSAYASHADGVKSALSVRENLQFWASLYGAPLDEGVFDDFDLAALHDRLAANLSAGQKRRLGLARLGVIGRKILFLDEPTVSLDRASVQRFGNWVRDRHLARGGIAVIATHIDLGLEAREIDIATFRADPVQTTALRGSDEAFL